MPIHNITFKISNILLLLVLFSIVKGQYEKNKQINEIGEYITCSHQKGNKIVNIKDFYNPSLPTAGFQDAVDYLKSDGGIIFVPSGNYRIRKSIVLFSGIHIIGEGEQSIIERFDTCIQQPLVFDGKKGDTEISIKDCSGFFKGGEIAISSNTAKSRDITNAVVLEVNDNSIKLDRPLKNNYLPEEFAVVMNFFPVFTATKAENIRIENLSIDGNMKPGSNFQCHFVCSAIHFEFVCNSSIDKVTIRRYPADGFSIQRGGNISVTNCIAEYNLGNGFHPGTELSNSTWRQNIGRFNGLDGLFFCYGVKYATVSDNHFYNNQKNGIGDLGSGGQNGDQMNIVSGNFCYSNGQAGIECTPGGNNIIVHNICENNSQAEFGEWPGIYIKDTHSSIFQGNRCIESNSVDSEKKQRIGILLIGMCENNSITGNILTGHSKGGIVGENLESNVINQNISINNHTPGGPKKSK